MQMLLFTRRGQAYAPPLTVKKRRSDETFKIGYALAGRGCGNVVPCRRAGNTAQFRYGDKDFQREEIETHDGSIVFRDASECIPPNRDIGFPMRRSPPLHGSRGHRQLVI